METAPLEHYEKNEIPRKRISKWDLAEDTNFRNKNSNPANDPCQVQMSNSKWDDVRSCNNTVSHADHSEKGPVKGTSEDKIKGSYYPIDLEIHAFSPQRKSGGSDQNKRIHTSPGHEIWKKHSRSPDYETSSYRSRSRSRSPKRRRKPESDGWINRNRSTLGGFEHWSTKHTDDYKYRDLRDKRDYKRSKNNRSDYDTENYEASWKNSTPNDGFSRGKYHRPTSKTRDTKGLDLDENKKAYNEYRRGTACKYFMEGRCRKGNSCQFSHEDSTQRKPEESVANDAWGNKSWVSCEQSDLKSEHISTNTERDWGDKWNHSIYNESRWLSGSKWSKISGNDNLNDPSKFHDVSKKDHDRILGHNRDLQPRICDSPKFSDRAIEERIPVISLDHMQQGSSHNKQTCTSHLVQLVPGQSLDINASNYKVNCSNQNLISHSDQSSDYKTPGCQDGSVEKANPFQSKTCVMASTSSTVAAITTEQVARISSLSGSLSQILGSGLQLPQLYATLNPPNGSSLVPFPNILPPTTNSYPWSEQQYDPIRDCIQVVVSNTDNKIPLNSTNVDVEKKDIMEKPLPSTSDFNVDSGDITGKSNIIIPQDKLPDKIEDTNPMEKYLEVSADVKINDGDGQVNGDNKKNVDAKSLKMFKFALVDFVKDILKPTWKEGNMSKEVHNTIVKKVVEKVSSTVHGPQIPQTQEKISHYLSYCKPKLTKLVQAYVAKYLKS